MKIIVMLKKVLVLFTLYGSHITPFNHKDLRFWFLGCREEREGLIPGGRRGSGSSEDLQTQHRDKVKNIKGTVA